MVKCNACGGTYEPILADGMQYFHVCPPLSAPELRAALDAGTVRLTKAQRASLDVAAELDAKAPVVDGATPRYDLALASLVVDRPNKRDENVRAGGDRGQPAAIKADGLGVSKVV